MKRARIVVLHENGLSYVAIKKYVGGNVTTSAVQSFVYTIRKHHLYKTQKEKIGKRAQQPLMVGE